MKENHHYTNSRLFTFFYIRSSEFLAPFQPLSYVSLSGDQTTQGSNQFVLFHVVSGSDLLNCNPYIAIYKFFLFPLYTQMYDFQGLNVQMWKYMDERIKLMFSYFSVKVPW